MIITQALYGPSLKWDERQITRNNCWTIIILSAYTHEFHEGRSPTLGTIPKSRRAIVTVQKLRRSSAWWLCGAGTIQHTRNALITITSMITASAKIHQVYALFQPFTHARELSLWKYTCPKFFVAARSVATPLATVLFAYMEDHTPTYGCLLSILESVAAFSNAIWSISWKPWIQICIAWSHSFMSV